MLDNKNISLTMRELMPYVEEELNNGKDVLLPVKGYSMTPFLINNRDSIILTRVNSRTVKVGDLVMFRREDGSYAMHRICRDNGNNTFDILGDAQYVADRNIRYDMIVAYVPKAIRNGKEVDCEKGAWRSIMTRYMRLRMKHPAVAKIIYKTLAMLYGIKKHILRTSDE